MIKVTYLEDNNLKEWYWNIIRLKLKQKRKKVIASKASKEWNDRLTDEQILKDILLQDLSFLKQKYKWIEKYIKASHMKCGDISENEIITQYINYSLLSQEVRNELVKKMNIMVCPYCNQNYICSVPLANGNSRYLGDIDHVLSKKIYPLFSLSLWNLVPSCKSCNQLLKRNIDVVTDGHNNENVNIEFLSPVYEGFGKDCIFKVQLHNVNECMGASLNFDIKWEANPFKRTPKDRERKIKANIDIFHLNEMYGVHKKEIQNILRAKAILSNKTYQKSLSDMTKAYNDKAFTPEMLLLGVNVEKNNFNNVPHSKMISDLLYYN